MNLLRKLNRIPDPFLEETKAYLALIKQTGGSIKMETLASCDRFIRSCMAAGVWTKLVEVMPICGNDLPTAMVKLKWTTVTQMTSVNFTGADYTERGPNGGIIGDGATKHVQTNLLQNANFANAHLSCYVRDTVAPGLNRYWIAANSVTDWLSLGHTSGPTPQIILGGSAVGAGAGSVQPGFYYGERASTTSLELFYNNASVSVATGLTNPSYSAINIMAWARNNNGAIASWSTNRLSFFSIGQNLNATERTALYNAVVTLQTALERNV